MFDSGGLDPAFGNGGIATTLVGSSGWATAVAVEPDGKTVAGGTAEIGGRSDFALVRYNTDGSLDTTFGNRGVVTTAIASDSDRLNGLAIAPGGDIVAVGQSFDGSSLNFTLARYKSDGSLDASFGQGGIDTSPVGIEAFAVAIQPDGRIVVAGSRVNLEFALARYLSDGSLDPSFGSGGVDVFSSMHTATAVAIQPDGKIVALGSELALAAGQSSSLVRVNADGGVDRTFGANGFTQVQMDSGFNGQAVLLQPDSKIVVGGAVTTQAASKPHLPVPPGTAQPAIETQDPAFVWFGVARYNADGSLDTSFGNAGIVTTKVAGGADTLGSLALEPDGRIVAGGGGQLDPDGTNPQSVAAAAIYNADGSLDTGFAKGGIFDTPLGAPQGGGLAAALDGKGNILLAGGAGTDGQHLSFAVARVITDTVASSGQPPALLDRLYQQLLGRSPDAAGLQYWTTQLAQGMSTGEVAAAFLSSSEYVARAISLDYQQLLHRNPDAQGLAYAVSAVESGKIDLNDVDSEMLASNEFAQQAGGTNTAWIDAIYTRLFGRTADSAGQTFWLNELSSEGRQQIAQMFVFSDENLSSEVIGWYNGILGMTPTVQQVANATAELTAGESESAVLAKVVASGS